MPWQFAFYLIGGILEFWSPIIRESVYVASSLGAALLETTDFAFGTTPLAERTHSVGFK